MSRPRVAVGEPPAGVTVGDAPPGDVAVGVALTGGAVRVAVGEGPTGASFVFSFSQASPSPGCWPGT